MQFWGTGSLRRLPQFLVILCHDRDEKVLDTAGAADGGGWRNCYLSGRVFATFIERTFSPRAQLAIYMGSVVVCQ